MTPIWNEDNVVNALFTDFGFDGDMNLWSSSEILPICMQAIGNDNATIFNMLGEYVFKQLGSYIPTTYNLTIGLIATLNSAKYASLDILLVVGTTLIGRTRHSKCLAMLMITLIADAHKGFIHFNNAGHFTICLLSHHGGHNFMTPSERRRNRNLTTDRTSLQRCALQCQKNKLLPHFGTLPSI